MSEMYQDRKRGSSRRKGDEYQDLTALRLALEHYINRAPFKMLLEYENSGNLDDIVVLQGTEITAFQIKYAVNPLDVYKLKDFTDSGSPVYLKKFADSWKIMRDKIRGQSLTACLCSNRGLDAALVDLVTFDGRFKPEVIEDRRRGDAKQQRLALESASGLDPDNFKEFLRNFHFRVLQPSLSDLKQHIQIVLLDKELGLSDIAVFFQLNDAITQNAIFSRDAITLESIDKLLERYQSKLLIPQVFPVSQEHFVERNAFADQLDRVLPQIDGGYLIVTGLPGSGKSTSLTTYLKTLDRARYEVFSYYCFVGVNDNAQRMRVRAESLRTNLLSEFHRRYPGVLKRRFDYTEVYFHECLRTLAEFFVGQGRKLVIFLDGLDHAERFEHEVTETVVSALPLDVPKGIAMVVGTQELHRWPHFLKGTRECSETRIEMPLFSEFETRNYLQNKRGISGLSHADMVEIHKKCEGLPLYLRYVAEIILSSDAVSDSIASLAPARDGDIRNYYQLLWAEFDQLGRAEARQLCAVMACLRFSVHRDELRCITEESLTRPQFEDAYKCMGHLLREFDDRLSVFHSSFRNFVIQQLPNDWITEVKKQIAGFLKSREDSADWFGHALEYCYEVDDDAYILKKVNADFVERALLRYRPSKEISEAIRWAIESAFRQHDVVGLSRLGALKFRTGDRLEHNLDRALLGNALLALGREHDVISFAYSVEADRWMVDSHVSLAVMSALANQGKLELGEKLFKIFRNEFRGIHSDNAEDDCAQVVGIARCLGVYSKRQAPPMRWLSQFKFTPGILEREDSNAPGYAPHLSAYIDTLVRFGRNQEWARLKRVRKLFPNRLVRYLLVRVLANHDLRDELRIAVTEYVQQEQPHGNVELAFYAAKAGLSASEVSAIAGMTAAPRAECPSPLFRRDSILWDYAYSFVAIAYEADESAYAYLYEPVNEAQTLWASALRHLLKASYCIGRSFRTDVRDWYPEACESLDAIVNAKQGGGERIPELIDLIRDVLRFTICSLTDEVRKRFPDQLDDWVSRLATLRDSLLWTTHFGLNESRQDYDFELRLWESLAAHPLVGPKLNSILRSCAATYEASTKLKGESRSNHFIWLAGIMARCGMREESECWLQYGIRSSLIYGYHKDVTLLYLIEMLKWVNQRHPDRALERCARVMWMVSWMPHLTDNRETKAFTEELFSAVLAVDRDAAFDLITQFSQSTARWQMEDCLRDYILSSTNGDPEYLWCLSELFSNHALIIDTRQHILDLVRESCSEEAQRDFEARFAHFVRTEVTPTSWPDEFKTRSPNRSDLHTASRNDTATSNRQQPDFMLDGQTITKAGVTERCRKSFSDFLATIEKLKSQNRFHERDLIDLTLSFHISEACSPEDLAPIKEYIDTQERWQQNPKVIEDLAKRFLYLGDQHNAVTCFGMAYACPSDSFFPWRRNYKYLKAIAATDGTLAQRCLLEKCYASAEGADGGYCTPPIAASGLDVLHDSGRLEAVFEDFLTHCESMFAQLPQVNEYAWLKDYARPSCGTNELILQFSMKELDTPEIDHGERLIRALTRLAIARPYSAIPLLVLETLAASGRRLRRLLMILHVLAAQVPDQLVSHQQTLVKLLDREDFFCRQTIKYVLDYVNKAVPLESSVTAAVRRIEGKYSPSVSHSSYRMPSNSSPEFLGLLGKHIHFPSPHQMSLMEKILRLRPGNLAAAIEARLGLQGWSIEEERSRIKDDWYGYVHPQGWPVIPITTEFQELVTEVAQNIVSEALEKLKIPQDQIRWLWQTIQMVDPERVLHGMMPRPADVEALRVSEEETWLNELDGIDSLQIGSPGTLEPSADWITVFERKVLVDGKTSGVSYGQGKLLRAMLIPLQMYGGSHELDNLDLTTERIVPVSVMAVTLGQARDALTRRGNDVLDVTADCIPLIAEHQNSPYFLGYSDVCTLASFIIDHFGLSFEGFDLTRDGEVVAKYEAWQEGYQFEAYTREKLAVGVRLRVSRNFLAEICHHYKRMLCVQINEEREHYEHIHARWPAAKRDSKRFVIYHF